MPVRQEVWCHEGGADVDTEHVARIFPLRQQVGYNIARTTYEYEIIIRAVGYSGLIGFLHAIELSSGETLLFDFFLYFLYWACPLV